MKAGLYGSKKLGAALGLLATAVGLAAAELVVGLIRGSSSPVVPVGQEFIDWTPKWLKDWAIEQFGTSDKAVLVTGALIVILLLGAAVGVLMTSGERLQAFALTGVIGVVGAWAVFIRPEPTLGKLMPTVVGTAVSIGVLWWLGPKPTKDPATGLTTMQPVDRRRFMSGAVTLGSAALVTGGMGRILQRRFEVNDERANIALPDVDTPATETTLAPIDSTVPGAETVAASQPFELGVEGIQSFVVPNDSFYRIDTALVVPQVSIDTWKLNISGMVDNPIELTFQDLLERPQVEKHITLSCVSNPIGGNLVGNALWQGVLLKDVLDEAGVQPGAEQLVSRSIDGWTCGTPTAAVMDGRDAMLAIAMNGEPLPAQHGYPVRMVVPGLFGYVSATKWVTDIRMTRWEDFDAYWVPRGWSKEGPVKTMARIDTPRSGSGHPGAVTLGGVAWAVHRGVSGVQVRLDEGEWRDCELAGVPSADTWVQWKYDLADATPGRHDIEVRALDGQGVPQPEGPADVAPNGAEGYHRISIDIDA